MNLITTSHRTLPLSLAITLAVALPATASTFLYEGRLDDRGQPANGRYDIQLAPYTTEKQGSALAPAITFEEVDVRDGRFRIDFDLALSEADSAWLELAVRAGDEGTTFSTHRLRCVFFVCCFHLSSLKSETQASTRSR